MEENKIRTREEILIDELKIAHKIMIPELLVERDIAFLSQDQYKTEKEWKVTVANYDSEVLKLQSRCKVIKSLIEQERQKETEAPFHNFYGCIAIRNLS